MFDFDVRAQCDGLVSPRAQPARVRIKSRGADTSIKKLNLFSNGDSFHHLFYRLLFSHHAVFIEGSAGCLEHRGVLLPPNGRICSSGHTNVYAWQHRGILQHSTTYCHHRRCCGYLSSLRHVLKSWFLKEWRIQW